MTDQTKTDSLFTFNMEDMSDQKTWSDIRLIHESDSGWCVVYSGLYRGRRVAIKGLKREFRSSELHRSLLQKEFEVTSIMNHQNIVATISMADVPGIGTAILLEYIDGLTLTEYLAIHVAIDRSKIADIIRQVCSAVDYMHSRQTIHCDLKPSNIMITHSGFVKIIDFGISRGNGFERLDFPGGTIGYTAPENFNSESGASVAVDIYSIGMLLEKMDRNGMFRGVWRKCLSSDPDKRPASATEISVRLDGINLKSQQRKKIYSSVAITIGILIISISIFIIWQPAEDSIIKEKAQERVQVMEPTAVGEEVHGFTPSPAIKIEPVEIKTIKERKIIKDSIASIVDEPNSDTRPFKVQLSEKLKQVVGLRFKQHLELIDTMTTVRSYELQAQSHWRMLAKQDMKNWLEEKLAPDYPKIEETMKDVERWIEWEADFSYRKGIESSHRADAIKKCPDLAGLDSIRRYGTLQD